MPATKAYTPTSDLTDFSVIQLLHEGWHIVYCPVGGGVIMCRGQFETERLSIQTFLDLREAKVIYHSYTLGQGHHIFHGGVDTYRLV